MGGKLKVAGLLAICLKKLAGQSGLDERGNHFVPLHRVDLKDNFRGTVKQFPASPGTG